MKSEVIAKVKNIIINSYIQPNELEDMFFMVHSYVLVRKKVDIGRTISLGVSDYEQFLIAFDYAREWFENKLQMLKIYNRKNELMSITFERDNISTGDAESPLS
jgi:hypothetical protein